MVGRHFVLLCHPFYYTPQPEQYLHSQRFYPLYSTFSFTINDDSPVNDQEGDISSDDVLDLSQSTAPPLPGDVLDLPQSTAPRLPVVLDLSNSTVPRQPVNPLRAYIVATEGDDMARLRIMETALSR